MEIYYSYRRRRRVDACTHTSSTNDTTRWENLLNIFRIIKTWSAPLMAKTEGFTGTLCGSWRHVMFSDIMQKLFSEAPTPRQENVTARINGDRQSNGIKIPFDFAFGSTLNKIWLRKPVEVELFVDKVARQPFIEALWKVNKRRK